MAQPPRRPVDPRDRRIAIIFVAIVLAFAIVSFAVAFWPRDDEEDAPPSPAPPAAASPTVEAASLGDDAEHAAAFVASGHGSDGGFWE